MNLSCGQRMASPLQVVKHARKKGNRKVEEDQTPRNTLIVYNLSMTTFPVVGELFDGRFQLLAILGKGALGTVFKAKQLSADRDVALKILHANFAADNEFILRFKREAQTLSSLDHENIVAVYSMGISNDEFPYLAMELVNGKSLRKVLEEEGKIDPERSIKLLSQCCDALDYIHAKQVVHRDLKPENLIVTDPDNNESLKLIDFGLVQLSLKEGDQSLTETGEIVGTVAYMSPEQCQSEPIDRRSDIYAICACFYEMLSGKAPFEGESPIAVMYMHTHNTIPQLKEADGLIVHPLMNAIISKGMAKDPTQRYQNANELKSDLILLEKQLALKQHKPSMKLGYLCAAVAIVSLSIMALMILGKAKNIEKTVTVKTPIKEVSLRHVIDPGRQYSRNKQASDQLNKLILMSRRLSLHGANEEALQVIKQAYDLSKTQSTADSPLPWNLRLAPFYLAAKQPYKAIELSKTITEADSKTLNSQHINRAAVLDAKSILALASLDANDEKEARLCLKDLCDPNNVIKQANVHRRTLACLLRLREYASAKKYIKDEKFPHYDLMLAAVSRGLKQLDIADFCISSIPPELIDKSLRFRTDYEVERAYNAQAEGHKKQAQEILETYLAGPGDKLVPE
ncbi:MAG: serine/threonine protein kinase, partial [Candidatus Obscuribacterales bacterium]|nr:serine/threonine protein kinase [Candidatus Obscuribacterales bacterium]